VAISIRDRHFLLLCNQVRESSHDPDRKVGAVIVDGAGQKLAVGANAPPPPLGLTAAESLEAIAHDPTWKYFMLEHAERNAIFAAHNEGKSLVGATMYGTLFPCADCARAIVAAGLSRLVVLGLDKDPMRDAKWIEHYRYADQILAMAGIAVEIVDPKEITTADQRSG
jgi:dCMP deaminase